MVRYYDESAVALKAYLRSLGFSPASRPTFLDTNGTSFIAQHDIWYLSEGTLYVKLRQPTENSAGLLVYICWHAEGSPGYLDSTEASANALRVRLTEWWDNHRRKIKE